MDPISFDEWKKLELRVGTVISAEPVPKSSKLFRIMVDLGETEPRQIVSGIQQYYTAEQLVGMRVIAIANLAPVQLMGVESRGMLLAAGDKDSNTCLLLTIAGDVPPGTIVT